MASKDVLATEEDPFPYTPPSGNVANNRAEKAKTAAKSPARKGEPGEVAGESKLDGKGGAKPRTLAKTNAASPPMPKAMGAKSSSSKPAPTETKSSIVLKKLRAAKGVTVEMLMEATGWQAHSVRGFLSAVVKKKLGLKLASETGKDGARRYRVDDESKAAR